MQLIRHRPTRRTRGDEGFSLVELVVTVAILGIVSAALLGVVMQYVKTTADTRARLAESTDQQFISTYWQNDVSSLGRLSFIVGVRVAQQSVFVGSAGPGGCGSPAGTTAVVAFAWYEFGPSGGAPADAWNTTLQKAVYVTVPKDGRLTLRRVRCRDGSASSTHTVAQNLTDPPVVACDTDCAATTPPNRVSMTFVVKAADHEASLGYTTTVSADRRQG